MRGLASHVNLFAIRAKRHIKRGLVKLCLGDRRLLGRVGDLLQSLIIIKRLVMRIFMTSQAGLFRYLFESCRLCRTLVSHYRFGVIVTACTVTGFTPNA